MQINSARENEFPGKYEQPYSVHLKPGHTVKQYTIEKKLGEGGFGIVYKVTGTDGAEYAMKLLKLFAISQEKERKLMLQRFGREYKFMMNDHPYLVQSHDYGKLSGNPFFIMDFCPGGSLYDYIGKNISFARINKFAYDILKGLEALHKEGKFHRDIKPENVLLDSDDKAKLTDFGIAGFINSTLTQVGNKFQKQLFGTIIYMAPENANRRIKKQYRYDIKVMSAINDIFSFGVTIYQLISNGRLPFGTIQTEAELADYIKRATKGEWDDITRYRPDTPPYWQEILNTCLDPDYENIRFQDVTKIQKKLGYQPPASPKPSFNPAQNQLALKVMDGEEIGTVYYLSSLLTDNVGFLTIGCTYDGDTPGKNDIALLENVTAYISNYHATIEKLNNPLRWIIKDGQFREKDGHKQWVRSTNGTLVNSVEIGMLGKELKPHDIIVIGDTTLKVILI